MSALPLPSPSQHRHKELAELAQESFQQFALLGPVEISKKEHSAYPEIYSIFENNEITTTCPPQPSSTDAVESYIASIRSESASPVVTFINGQFSSKHSTIPTDTQDVFISTLRNITDPTVIPLVIKYTKLQSKFTEAKTATATAASAEDHDENVPQHLITTSTPSINLPQHTSSFLSLNSSFFDDLTLIRVAPGRNAEVHVVHFMDLPPSPTDTAPIPMLSPRVVLLARRGASVRLVQHYVARTYLEQQGDSNTLTALSTSKPVYVTNAVADVFVEDGATVDCHKLQCEDARAVHVAHVNVLPDAAPTQPLAGRRAQISVSTCMLGASLTHEDAVCYLAGDHSEFTFNGLSLAQHTQQTDTHITVHHLAPHCVSKQLQRMVLLSDQARGAFTGSIVVHPNAHDTTADQLTNSLLVADGAIAKSTPLLQINNDDVQCKHGATVGTLDENAIYYLRQRGIGLEHARTLLMEAFVEEVLKLFNLPAALAAVEERLCKQRLAQAVRLNFPAHPPAPPVDKTARLDPERCRKDFPILRQYPHLAYFDNAATTQKPQCVLQAIADYYETSNSNVHRGVHQLAELSTQALHDARGKVQRYIHAAHPYECIFVRGTTEAINLVAYSFAMPRLGPGDLVVLTEMEHHANIVPWQIICEEKGAAVKAIPVDHTTGCVSLGDFEEVLQTGRVKLVAVTHASNVLATVNPIKELCALAHHYGTHILIDGAQAIAHHPVDVIDLDCDFFCFSAHKHYGPTGIGVLYGKEALLKHMRPWQSGGDMIRTVSFDKGTTFASLPNRLEAGTPNIAGSVGMGASLDYLSSIGIDRIAAYEHELTLHCLVQLREIPKIRIIGWPPDAPEKLPPKGSILSFVVEGVHAHDLGTLLDGHGIAVRAGHHCAMPLMTALGIDACVRASFAFYNTFDEVDRFIVALRAVVENFRAERLAPAPAPSPLLGATARALHPPSLSPALPQRPAAPKATSFPNVEDLYQEVIIEHGRHPRNFRIIEEKADGASRLLTADGYNSLCGDRVNVYIRVVPDPEGHWLLEDVSFQGSGCAISQASSSLMTEIVRGQAVEDALQMFDQFHLLVTTGTQPDCTGCEDGTGTCCARGPTEAEVAETASFLRSRPAGNRLGKLSLVFSRVCSFPSRVKCAILAWHTLMKALRDYLPAPTGRSLAYEHSDDAEGTDDTTVHSHTPARPAHVLPLDVDLSVSDLVVGAQK